MTALKAENVRRSFGGGREGAERKVLDGFSLVLEEGAFEALMGPSGSGKTTFLHIAAGLVRADSGRVEVGGRDVTAMGDSQAAKFRRNHIGVVFQDFNLFEDKTVRDNILYPLRLAGRRPDPSRFDALVAATGLAERIHCKCSLLSGGERQRVAIARALVAAPDLVLADEPTGNLDCAATADVCALLKRLNATERSAILVVTHDPVVAACAGRVHFLKDGAIAASCEPGGDSALVSRLYLENCR